MAKPEGPTQHLGKIQRAIGHRRTEITRLQLLEARILSRLAGENEEETRTERDKPNRVTDTEIETLETLYG